jgi:hypothetical protein
MTTSERRGDRPAPRGLAWLDSPGVRGALVILALGSIAAWLELARSQASSWLAVTYGDLPRPTDAWQLAVSQSLWPMPGLYFVACSLVVIGGCIGILRVAKGHPKSLSSIWLLGGAGAALARAGGHPHGTILLPTVLLLLCVGVWADMNRWRQLLAHIALALVAAGFVTLSLRLF